MRRSLIALIAIIAFVALIAASAFYLAQPNPGFPGSRIITDHPQLEYAASCGRPVLVYFSTPDCPACLLEDRIMDILNPEYNESVTFVYFKYTSELGRVFEDWSVIKVPTIVLIDKTGKIFSRFDGVYVVEEALRAELERIV